MEGRTTIYAAFELERQLGRDELVGEVKVADFDTLCTSDADPRNTRRYTDIRLLVCLSRKSLSGKAWVQQPTAGPLADSTDTTHALSCMNQ